jgi:hypothetical protein
LLHADPDLLQGTGKGSNDKATNPSGCFDPSTMKQTKGWYQTESQARAQFSMWAIMSAPLLIAADPGQVEPSMIETWGNEEIINVSQSFREGGPYQGARIFGGDLSYRKGGEGSGTNVWGKLLPGGDFALGFVSNENTPTSVTCDGACASNHSATIAAFIHLPYISAKLRWYATQRTASQNFLRVACGLHRTPTQRATRPHSLEIWATSSVSA